MKILLLPNYFYPERYAGWHLEHDIYELLSISGYSMVAYAPMPSRGIDSEIRREYKNRYKEFFFNGKLLLHRFPLYAENKSSILRAIRYTISIIIQFMCGLFSQNIGLLYLESTPPIVGIIGGLLHKIKKIPFVYAVQDIFPDSLVSTGLSHEGSLAWIIGRIIENFTYRNATRIIVISQDFKRNLLKKNVPEEKIEVIHNWIDTTSIFPVERYNNTLFSEWELNPSLFYIVYAGNFGNAQSVHTIIESAQLLQSETDIQFLLIGGGSQEDTLKELVISYKLQNVKFFPLQSSEKLSYVYSLGDVGIVCCKQGVGKNAFPSKTWSYLAAGTPIIASYDLDSELASMANSNGFGISINPENAQEMADSILKIRNNKQLLQEMSSTAKTFVEAHASKEKAMKRYLQVINSVISSN
ncbi:hypothetical protein SDC9_69110 [bioreactor metagenome]|uniref:Glycosyl transferase family 1 domain-containing protein n=1 Tax=bioreactor metagenome TaxID=1076179 RepID=A0A644Y289_9ZZZZ